MKYFFSMARILLGIVGLIIIIILGGQVLPGVVDQTSAETYSENFATTTGVNVTTATETLGYDSYYDDLTGLSATSDNGADYPAVMAYDPDTDEVTIAGLHASDTRILTIDYSRDAAQNFYGLSPFLALLPVIVIIGGIVACIVAIYTGVRSRG